VIASVRWLRILCWALVILTVISAVVSVLLSLGILLPFNDAADLVDRLEANRASDTSAFPVLFLGWAATAGVFLVAALLGAALRPWAAAVPPRDTMTVLFVVAGVIGVGANLLSIGLGEAATAGYCDCGYRAEEIIAQNYALNAGRAATDWLSIGAVTLVGLGVAVAGRLVAVSSAWRILSYLIALVLIVAVMLRALASFVLIEAIDPFQISSLATAFAAGILVPIWAILLAGGIRDRRLDAGEPAITTA
jgi:hypothetical protein